MSSEGAWYLDHESLLGELQRSVDARSERPAAPQIAGYGDWRELGRGGQGVVYRAVQRSTRRDVAIKLLLDGAFASPSSRGRFEREVELVAGLRHPNIVRIYDSGVTGDGRLYYVMEHIEGKAFDEWTAACGLRTSDGPRRSAPQTRGDAIGRILALCSKICDAVQHAHLHGVIHRDLKPSNIRIDDNGEPHILDFGLAKVITTSGIRRGGEGTEDTERKQGESAVGGSFIRNLPLTPSSGVKGVEGPQISLHNLTLSGHFMGSLPWSSPEQAEGRPERIDVRTDVYALGVIVYQSVTGQYPYAIGGSLREALDNIVRAAPARPSSLNRALDDELDTIILKTLAKEPERRYQSAAELAADLRHYLAGEPIEAKRASAWYSVRKTLRRYELAAKLGAVLLVATILFGARMWFLRERAQTAERLADQRLAEAQTARDQQAAARAAAEREAELAKQIQRFLQEMLASVDPEMARGRDVTLLRGVLERAAKRVEMELGGQPLVAAALQDTIASTYWGLGDFDAAAHHAEASLALRRSAGAAHTPESLRTLNNLAGIYQDQSRFAEAEPLLRDALSGLEAEFGIEHPDTLKAMGNLAMLLENQGKLAEAEALCRQTLALRRRVLGEDADDTLTAKNNLGTLLLMHGALAEAEPLIREAYETRLRRHGEDDPESLVALHNVAELLEARGEPAEAEAAYRQAIEMSQRVLGENHASTLATRRNFGALLQRLGKLDEAEAILRDVLDRFGATAGDERPEVMYVQNELALLLHDRGRTAEAVAMLEPVVARVERTHGAAHPSTLTTKDNLAALLAHLGRRDEAIALHRQVLAEQRRVLPAADPSLLLTLNNLAAALRDAGRCDEAVPLYREALQLTVGEDGAADRRLPVIQGGLAACLTGMGEFAEAEALLLASLPAMEAQFGTQHKRTRQLLDRLVELYEAQGKSDAADKYRRRP